jgi:Domain of unknown function (DUF222)
MNQPGTLTPESVLDAARATRAGITDLEIAQLQQAVEWVLLHPGDEVDESVDWSMREMEIAGEGAPTIDEGAIAEFALAIGVSTDSGRLYLGDAVELRYRLPRIWRKLRAGVVPVWKARKVAQATHSLPMAGAAAVDRALYFVLHKCSFAEIDRQVDRARAEHDPVEAERRYVESLEKRHLHVHLKYMTSDGLVPVSGMLDVADAVALDASLAAKASGLDPRLSLDVRRSMAAGMLGTGETHREVVVYAHTRPGQAMVEVENTRSVITPGHLKEWCQQFGTKVTVRPVIDLNEELSTDCYEPTELMKEQVRLRRPQCVFPLCHRPARPGDADHIVEWPLGRTTTSNLAPLCRGHHRLKTHTAWTYSWVPGIGFVWTSPLGHRHTG